MTFLLMQLSDADLLGKIASLESSVAGPDLKLERLPHHVKILQARVPQDQLPGVRTLIMKTLFTKVDQKLIKENFQIEIKGVGVFEEGVLAGEVGKGADILANFNTVFMDAFEAAGFICDARFIPQVDLLKGSGIPKDAEKWSYDKILGYQQVSSHGLKAIELCQRNTHAQHIQRSILL